MIGSRHQGSKSFFPLTKKETMSYYNSYSTPFYKSVWFFVTSGVVATILAVLGYLWGPQLMREMFTYGRNSIPFTLIIVAIILLAIASYVVSERSGLGALVAAVVAVGLLALLVTMWFRVSYDSARNYVDDFETTESASVSYAQRAPQQVAVASATRTLQDTIGSVGQVKSVADEGEDGLWNTLVTRPGFGVGFESVQSVNVPLYGPVSNKDVELCKFDQDSANRRLGGALPSNSLARAIYAQTPFSVGYNGSDAYGYCENDTPYVVVPLQQVSGFYAAEWNVYGVAVYNGSNGDLDVYTDSKDVAKIPGPTYPMSMAERQRDAAAASGSYADMFFGRAGYDDTAKDEGDPNGNNNTEFQLRSIDGNSISYVTPLTTRGESTTIVGVSDVAAQFTAQGRNPVEVTKFGDNTRSANSAIVNDLQTTYSNLTDWATGLEVFEIVPADDGNWVASIGKSQSVLYRAEIHTDGTFVLRDSKGNVIPNNDRGDGTNPDALPTDVPTGNLSELSTDELSQLGQDVLDELARRAADTQ